MEHVLVPLQPSHESPLDKVAHVFNHEDVIGGVLLTAFVPPIVRIFGYNKVYYSLYRVNCDLFLCL